MQFFFFAESRLSTGGCGVGCGPSYVDVVRGSAKVPKRGGVPDSKDLLRAAVIVM